MPPIRVRPYEPSDRGFALGLAPRLATGIPPWRETDRMVSTARDWVVSSLERPAAKGQVFVAEDSNGTRLGFASVSEETHFTGEVQGYLGELVVREEDEGQGVGRALVAACEEWSRERGHRILALSTGVANARARRFYQGLGFAEEDVKLAKLLTRPP